MAVDFLSLEMELSPPGQDAGFDLGLKDRKYLDHTATHSHRGVGDLTAVCGAWRGFADWAEFGPYWMRQPLRPK